MRTTKAVVEENVLGGGDAGPRMMAWMVHHAGHLVCACMVGEDGLTPFRRLKGRKFGTPLAGFGERAWLRDPALERAKSEMHRGEVAWILNQVIRCHQKVFSRPPIWGRRQPSSHVGEGLGRKSIPLHNVYTGRQIAVRVAEH